MGNDRDKENGPKQVIPEDRWTKEFRIAGEDVEIPENITPEMMQKVVRKLRDYQNEIEMQNQELREVRDSLEESREKYVDLYDYAPVGYLSLNPDGLILDANLTASREFDLERQRLVGRSFWSYVAREDRDLFYFHLRDTLQGKSRVTCELRLTRKAGTWVRMESIATKDLNGNQVCRSSLIDITEQKRAEEASRESRLELELRVQERTAELNSLSEKLRELAHQLTEAEGRERARIAGILHDDLQQLLAGAKLRLELSAGEADPVVKMDLEKSRELIVQALRVSRTLTEELSPLVLEHENLNNIVEWVCDFMQEAYNLKVEFERADEVAIHDRDTRVFLLQILRELLFNVVKHSGTKSARIRVGKESGDLQVTVIDKGVGFEPGEIGTGHERGTGLGLFSIRERLSYLGGALDFDTAPGKGTTCTLTMPMGDVKHPEKQEKTYAPLSTQAVQEETSGTIRVMLVDDHRIVREGFAALLEDEPGIAIVGEADDGEKAIEKALELAADVILMDINMPGKNGIEATRTIQSLLPNTRVIGLSMDDSKATLEAMKAVGASGLLSKASSSEELVAAIRGLI